MSDYVPDVSFEALTPLLGSAIIAWSHCEEATEHLLRDVLQYHGLEEETARLIASTLELKPRCILGLALAYKLHIPQPVMERLATALNKAQNELRNTRNRIVHDSWMLNEGSIQKRTSTGPKLTRPEARKLELFVPTYTPVDAKAVIDFSRECLDSSREVHNILGIIADQYFGARLPESTGRPGSRNGWLHRLRHIFARKQPPTSII